MTENFSPKVFIRNKQRGMIDGCYSQWVIEASIPLLMLGQEEYFSLEGSTHKINQESCSWMTQTLNGVNTTPLVHRIKGRTL